MSVTGQLWENKLNWIPDSAPATSRNHGIVNSALCPGTERREQTRTENQENEAPLSDSADLGANWMQNPRRDQCKGKSPFGQTASQNSTLCNLQRDEEGYAPCARKNRLYETLIGHTGSHTQEPIKLIMLLISDPLPLTGLISRPGEAGSSNSASDLVESTSPKYRSHLKLVEALSPRVPTPAWSLSRPCLQVIAPTSSSSRFNLWAIIPAWASRRCYFPPSRRLPLCVSSPAVTPTLSLSWPHPRSRT